MSRLEKKASSPKAPELLGKYWIVDTGRRMVSVCINGEPMQITIYSFGEDISFNVFEKLKIYLKK